MMYSMFENLSEDYLVRLTFSVTVLLITFVFSLFLKKGIDVVFAGVNRRMTHEALIARTKTIRSLVKNIVDVVVFLIALLIILSRWNINIMPILTGAGLAGLAISFGAQTLVKDIISGFFIILEDQFSVGDKVKIDKHEGTVERVTIRLTVLRDKNNHLVYIPNSQITTVVRYDTKPRIATVR